MRLWKRTPTGNESITFYGARGERLGTYPLSTANQAVLVSPGATNVYFNGRLLGAPDRLGSTVATYPYGGEYTTTAQDRDKFATYYRDGASLLGPTTRTE